MKTRYIGEMPHPSSDCQRILVTGGAGFIGSHLVDRLLADGIAVTVLDNLDPFYDPGVKYANIKQHFSRQDFTFVEGDLCNEEILAEFPDDIDVIVHLAAKAGVRPSIEDPVGYGRVNVKGTQNMLEFARNRGIKRFVFASSSSVYGMDPNIPWHENAPMLRPISPYASTKVSSELLGHVYSHLYGIHFVALRFFTVYGPRQRPDLAIHKFARRMLQGEPIPVYGDGSSSRDYTYISDIISGIVAAIHYTGMDMTNDSTPYEVINLGNNRAVSLRDLIGELESAFKIQAKIEWLPLQSGDVPYTLADITKAKTLLGFQPSTKLQDGLRYFAAWLQGKRSPEK